MDNTNKQKRKKVCPRCGRKLWLREFAMLKSGYRHSWCHDCIVQYKRERYNQKFKVPEGIFLHPTIGRIMEHNKYSTRIFWSENMLSIMRRKYHNTLNKDLAEILGVCERTVTRKAKKMGLKKDKEFLASLSRQNLLLANARSKELGHPCGFKNGIRFKGNQYTGKVRVK